MSQGTQTGWEGDSQGVDIRTLWLTRRMTTKPTLQSNRQSIKNK